MKPEHILIRCKDCTLDACTVSCDSNAVAYIMGDILIEAVKCEGCGKNVAPIPDCIMDCRNSAEKLIRQMISVEEKRRIAADSLPLLTV